MAVDIREAEALAGGTPDERDGYPVRAVRQPFIPAGYSDDPRFRWLVVHTEFHAEKLARKWIGTLLPCVWLPEIYDPPKTAAARRRRLCDERAGRRDADADVVPLFRGYLLAQADPAEDTWRTLHLQPGVERVIGTGSSLAFVPQRAMDLLWSQCAPDGVIRPAAPLPLVTFRRGQKVALAAPPDSELAAMSGLVGICERSNKDRVTILLNLLGREVRVSAQRRYVEQV